MEDATHMANDSPTTAIMGIHVEDEGIGSYLVRELMYD